MSHPLIAFAKKMEKMSAWRDVRLYRDAGDLPLYVTATDNQDGSRWRYDRGIGWKEIKEQSHDHE